MSTENKVTKKEVRKSFLIWLFFSHSCYNYERMMGLACCWSLQPIIKKLYPDDVEKRKEALHRELSFFNTEVCWGACAVGLAGAMEEQIAAGADVDPNTITSVKSALMGPLAGIGDTVTQGIIFPLVISIAVGITLDGNSIVGPLIVLFGHSAYDIIVRRTSFYLGHNKGSETIFGLLENGKINTLVKGAGIVGCMVMGGLIASYVTLNIAATIQTGYASFNFQTDFLDLLVPNVLPLVLTLVCWKLLNKGWSTNKLLLAVTAVGLVGALVGLF